MKVNKRTKIVSASIVVILIATLTSVGYLCFLKGKNSVHNEGIRTATFCNNFAIPEEPRLATDMRGEGTANYKLHSTFALFNASEDSHIDVYGKMKLITPYCAVLHNHEGELFGVLTVINDLAVLVTESGEIYELKYYDVGTYVSDDESEWQNFFSK